VARRHAVGAGGTLVLDCQGLSLLIKNDVNVVRRIAGAHERGARVVISGLTVLEAQHSGLQTSRFTFVLSMLRVEEAVLEVRQLAGELLRSTGMPGHRHVVDAVVAATALKQRRPTLMLTSDPDDLNRLCTEFDRSSTEQVRIVKV